MARRADPAVAWLVDEADPAVRVLASQDLLDQPLADVQVESSPIVQGLLAGLIDERSVGKPYDKWWGLHWRLVSLVELGILPENDSAQAGCDILLGHWSKPGRLARVPVVEGRARRCASQEGNALAVARRLGRSGDARAVTLTEHLLAWQWPDGGWNCDKRPRAGRSSFHETLPALLGLVEYESATGDGGCRAAITTAAELLLDHEIVFSARTDEPMHPSFLEPHYPPYWHYDLLQALLVLCRAGFVRDPRSERARKLLAARRHPEA